MSIKIVRWDGLKGRAFIECDGAPVYAKKDEDGFPVYTLPDTPGAQRLAASLCSVNANKYRLLDCGPFSVRVQASGGRFDWVNVNPWVKLKKNGKPVWVEVVEREQDVAPAEPATELEAIADLINETPEPVAEEAPATKPAKVTLKGGK